ncbi:hypothetical protein ES703_112023 [subsurface metagenome]
MEEELRTIRSWASHGTLRQFRTEMSAKVAADGYGVTLEGDTLTVYRIRKEGGFLGIGARKIEEPVLVVIGEGANMRIPEESADEEFLALLAPKLKQH